MHTHTMTHTHMHAHRYIATHRYTQQTHSLITKWENNTLKYGTSQCVNYSTISYPWSLVDHIINLVEWTSKASTDVIWD